MDATAGDADHGEALRPRLVYMFKDTPILAAITVRELMQVAPQIGADNFRYMEPLTIVGALFLAMSVTAAYFIRVLERRVAVC